MRLRLTPYEHLRKNWLLVAILICVSSASIYPKLGSKQGKQMVRLETQLTL